MAYVDQSAGRNQRATVMIAVALLQGAAFIALVNGLAVQFTKAPTVPNPEGQRIEVPLPPPPVVPKKTVEQRETRITRAEKPIETTSEGYNPPASETPVADPPKEVAIADPPPLPKPSLVPPRSPSALGRPGEWVTANDYPTSDLRLGNQGATGFRLTIGTDGQVRSCTITRSSGFRGLDEATCRNLTRRARFKPATDGEGNPVAGEYASTIRWVIPD